MTPTGPGRVTTDARARSSGYTDWIYLENFDIDGVTLKIEHRNELTRRFGGMHSSGDLMMPDDNKWIFLRGYASRTGASDHNLDLSNERVLAVHNFLLSLGISDNHITGLDYVGEEWSHSEIEEDDQFRCVEVIARLENITPPPSTPVFIRDRFRMRAKPAGPDVIGAIADEIDLPGGLGSTVLMIQIENRSTHERRDFLFVSLQVTGGLSIPFSGTPVPTSSDLDFEYGDWVNFRTRSQHHVAFSEFVGSATFGGMISAQIGTFNAGDNYFSFDSENLHHAETYVVITPRTIVLPMPTTVGLSFSLISMSAFGRLMLWP